MINFLYESWRVPLMRFRRRPSFSKSSLAESLEPAETRSSDPASDGAPMKASHQMQCTAMQTGGPECTKNCCGLSK